MNRNFDELLKNNEILEYNKDGFYYKEEYYYKEVLKRFKCSINCSPSEKWDDGGSVGITILIDDFIRRHIAGFGNLMVFHKVDRRKGTGTALMYAVFSLIKELKEYYRVHELVQLSGLLAYLDKIKGNWSSSIPFYEKFGIITNTKTEFKILKTNEIVMSSTEFLDKVGESDGHIIYYL